jgi:hypothetical protein|tara:strand:- start:820 stop:1407 length:588 start_codon:yes stop_codon:yes gene_type:complete
MSVREYKIDDTVIINGVWHVISGQEDGQWFATDEDGGEVEFQPGTEDHRETRKAIIVDVDGTIAHRAPQSGLGKVTTRDPYDMTRVVEDEYDPIIGGLAQLYGKQGYDVIVVSARTEEAREGTIQFMVNNDFEFDALFMRQNKDNRKDSIVKTEIFQNDIAGNWDIEFVLDDRDQTVEAWRELGLKTLQVATGDF